jgi:hypothetical protein
MHSGCNRIETHKSAKTSINHNNINNEISLIPDLLGDGRVLRACLVERALQRLPFAAFRGELRAQSGLAVGGRRAIGLRVQRARGARVELRRRRPGECGCV